MQTTKTKRQRVPGKVRDKKSKTLLAKTIKENYRLKKQVQLKEAGEITFILSVSQIDKIKGLALDKLLELKSDLIIFEGEDWKQDLALMELEKEKKLLESIINSMNFQ